MGYYVSNDYVEEALREEPPTKVLIEKVQRNILADKPRVTKFPIVFNSGAPAMDHLDAQKIPDAYAYPPSDLAMQTHEGGASSSLSPDSMHADEDPTEETCIPSSPPADLMHTDEEASESNRPTSSATDLMTTNDTEPADIQAFDSMQHGDTVRRGNLHTPQALQEVC